MSGLAWLTLALVLLVFRIFLAAPPLDHHTKEIPDLLDNLPPLRFNSEGELSILIFNDLHYGEPFPSQDVKSDSFQRTLLRLEKPDFVVYNGDMSTNYNAPQSCQEVSKNCSGWWINLWERWTQPMMETETRYALNMGNHDPIGPGISPDGRDILKIDRQNRPVSYSRMAPAHVSRASNYYIPIFDPQGNFPIGNCCANGQTRWPAQVQSYSHQQPEFFTYASHRDNLQVPSGCWIVVSRNRRRSLACEVECDILASGTSGCLGRPGWGCVLPDQVRWFTRSARKLAHIAKENDYTGTLFGHLFIHIPIEEALDVWTRAVTARNASVDKLLGHKIESVDCSAVNTGVWAAVQELKGEGISIEGIWHGHDHNNDFVGEVTPGSKVGYGRKSGYGGYGGAIADHPGARVLKMKLASGLNGETRPERLGMKVLWSTYIRLENGEIDQQNPPNMENETVQALCAR